MEIGALQKLEKRVNGIITALSLYYPSIYSRVEYKDRAFAESVKIFSNMQLIDGAVSEIHMEIERNEFESGKHGMKRYYAQYKNKIAGLIKSCDESYGCWEFEGTMLRWSSSNSINAGVLTKEYNTDSNLFYKDTVEFFYKMIEIHKNKIPGEPWKYLKYLYYQLKEIEGSIPDIPATNNCDNKNVNAIDLIDPAKRGIFESYENNLREDIEKWVRKEDIEDCAAFVNLLYENKFFIVYKLESIKTFALSQYGIKIESSLNKLRKRQNAAILSEKTDKIRRKAIGKVYGKT